MKELLKIFGKPPPPQAPAENMYSRGEIIYCSGDTNVAKANNEAAELMEKGNFKSAEVLLKAGLKRAPIFFPFRYNIGLCYIHLNNFKLAQLNLEKAANMFPEYHKTYLQIGYIFERRQKFDIALGFYRRALKINPRAYNVFVLIGDIYFNRNQLDMADKYYNASLEIAPGTPNAQLGIAKIQFRRKNFYKSYIIIRTINLDGEYDISLHYYYAECAYKLQDYKIAFDQYNILLQFKNDKFFLTTSVSLINHKIDLCKRFIEVR